mmetsp:Transcript_10535/g.31232  ORF Transcript_10535/g.31232 Transcript_10535/m.31232 type:complete len:287 (-) Transcript_10535:156-1016(-)
MRAHCNAAPWAPGKPTRNARAACASSSTQTAETRGRVRGMSPPRNQFPLASHAALCLGLEANPASCLAKGTRCAPEAQRAAHEFTIKKIKKTISTRSPMMRHNCLLSPVSNKRPIRFITKFSFAVSLSMSLSKSSSILRWSVNSWLIEAAAPCNLDALDAIWSSVSSCCLTICCWCCLSRSRKASLSRDTWFCRLELTPPSLEVSTCRLSASSLACVAVPVTLSWISLTVARPLFAKPLRLAISASSIWNLARLTSTKRIVSEMSCRSKSSCRKSPQISACKCWKR